MELKSKAIGKLYYRTKFFNGETKTKEYIGIIWSVSDTEVGFIRIDSDSASVFRKEFVVDFKATKSLSKESREQLKKLAEIKIKKEEEEKRHRETKDFLVSEECKYRKLLRDSTGILSPNEFRQEAEKLFNKFSANYLRVGSCSDTELSVTQSNDVEKWPSPEKFSFIYREYDNALSFYSDAEESSDYKKTVKCFAPTPIRAIEKLAHSSDAYLSLGDKFLVAYRCYIIKHSGYTKASLEELKKKLGG